MSIIILIWLVSIVISWTYFHIAYSKKGIWFRKVPDGFFVFLVFMPVLNSIFSLVCWVMESPYLNAKERRDNFNKKFFLIK